MLLELLCSLQVSNALYPLVSSTAPETELQLGVRSQRISSLQEQCIHIISQSLSHYRRAHELPLPKPLLCQIHAHNKQGMTGF